MGLVAHVAIHPSQFPAQVRRDLLASLRTRQINHKFHYDSYKQTQKWLALHQVYAPSRTEADCTAVYDQGFAGAVERIPDRRVHVVGLGCGGGQKDARLLKLLQAAGREVFYTPSDVSTAMVLVAREAALTALPPEHCFPLVCDLAVADDVADALKQSGPVDAARLITFFGMIPNFEPQLILPRLAALVRPRDYLLFSANLAPGPDYAAGVQRILPQYDNELTREWLLAFLLDLGLERSDGKVEFVVEADPAGSGLKRVAAYFRCSKASELRVDEERFQFRAGDSIRLFFSYRHTPALVRELLGQHGLQVRGEWVTRAEEEGVFFVMRGA